MVYYAKYIHVWEACWRFNVTLDVVFATGHGMYVLTTWDFHNDSSWVWLLVDNVLSEVAWFSSALTTRRELSWLKRQQEVELVNFCCEIVQRCWNSWVVVTWWPWRNRYDICLESTLTPDDLCLPTQRTRPFFVYMDHTIHANYKLVTTWIT